MNSPRKKRRDSQSVKISDVKQVLYKLLKRTRDPSRLLEAYYWGTEPELAEFIRQFLSLPTPARLVLTAFLRMAGEAAESVEISIGTNGEITLSSSAVAEAMKIRTPGSIPQNPSGSIH